MTTNYCNTALANYPDLSITFDTETTTVESPKIYITTAKFIKKSVYDDNKVYDSVFSNKNKHYTPEKLNDEILYFDPSFLATSIDDINNDNYIPNNSIALAYVYFDVQMFKLKNDSTHLPRTFKKFWTGHLIFHSNGYYGTFTSGGQRISEYYKDGTGGNFAALDITLIQLNDANDNISLIFNASTWNILYTNIKFCDTLIKYAEYYPSTRTENTNFDNQFQLFNNKYNTYKVSGNDATDSVYSIPLRMKLIIL
jgi:hypothetical protein